MRLDGIWGGLGLKCKIADMVEINRKTYSDKFNWKCINYLDTSNLNEGCFGECQKLMIGKDKIPSRAKRIVKKKDILISTVRPNQRHYGLLKNEVNNLLVSTGFVVLTVKKDIVVADYLYRYLTQDFIVDYLQKIAEDSTSAYPSIKPSVIGDLEVELPPINEQKAIAKILSSLDDKIELNNRINKTLEEMAQTIFKRWFVDFEFPDENGEPYKSSGGEMIESELGMIPIGWEVGSISDLGNIVGGATPSTKNIDYFTKKGIPWITPKDLSENKNKYISCGNIDITKKGYHSSSTKLLPKGSVLFSSRAPIGYISIAKNELTTNQGFKSVIPKENIGSEYIYYFLKFYTGFIETRAVGSTFKEVSGSVMKAIPAIIPKIEVVSRFNDVVNTFGKQMGKVEQQTQTLTKIRDTLLPKLMSGEIRVPVD